MEMLYGWMPLIYTAIIGTLVASLLTLPVWQWPTPADAAIFLALGATGALGQRSQPGKPLYGIEHSNDGLITFPGGLPIVDEEGVLIGGIGVSGSTVENDRAVAEAGLKVAGVCDLPEHPWRT